MPYGQFVPDIQTELTPKTAPTKFIRMKMFKTSYNAIKLNQTLEMRPFMDAHNRHPARQTARAKANTKYRSYFAYFTNTLLPPYWYLSRTLYNFHMEHAIFFGGGGRLRLSRTIESNKNKAF